MYTSDFDNRITTNIEVLDFSKAFDVVPNKKLVQLGFYGVRGLQSRTELIIPVRQTLRVIVNGVTSKWHKVGSEVPQETVLGPYLFSLLKRHQQRSEYTTTVCCTIKSSQSSHVEQPLQKDLNTLVDWAGRCV